MYHKFMHCQIGWILISWMVFFFSHCEKNPCERISTKDDTGSSFFLIVPYINESDITDIQPFGVPLDFGGGDIRPHAAIDLGCPEGVEFVASASGRIGNIWLNYPHSYQFNIVIDAHHTLHYCLEPINAEVLSDEDKLNAIYFSPGDFVQVGQKVCKMIGGGGHLDWGLIIDGERVCPACYLSDEQYEKINTLFKKLPGSYEGYPNLCPENSYHTKPRS